MSDLSTTRGIDFLQARTQVIKSIRLAIKKHEDSGNRGCDAANILHSSDDQSCCLTLLATPAVCCILLIVSLSSQTSTLFISGLLVPLLVIIAVVLLNMHFHRLVSTAESKEIQRELEKILYDYEKFSSLCISTIHEGNAKECTIFPICLHTSCRSILLFLSKYKWRSSYSPNELFFYLNIVLQ